MKIAVRMDDITTDMDWERFLTFKEILDEHDIKPLIGVVPNNKDENLNRSKPAADFWEYIKKMQADGWCIALHGFQHVYTTKKGGLFPLNHFSEFAGLSFDKQKEMLKKGTEILNGYGIKTDIFMAPGHSYDRNTIMVLKELGYCRITDGFGNRPYEWHGMSFYPISFMMSRSLKKKKGITTMVVHTNEVGAEEMERYRRLFREHEGDFISYHIYLQEDTVKRGFMGRGMEYLLANLKCCLVKLILLCKGENHD